MSQIPYHAVDLPRRDGVTVACRGVLEHCACESIWNGRDISPPEPNRRHAPPTSAAALPADPEQMVRQALAVKGMTVAELAAHYGVAGAVFSRVLARLCAEQVIAWRYERHNLVRVYRLVRGKN